MRIGLLYRESRQQEIDQLIRNTLLSHRLDSVSADSFSALPLSELTIGEAKTRLSEIIELNHDMFISAGGDEEFHILTNALHQYYSRSYSSVPISHISLDRRTPIQTRLNLPEEPVAAIEAIVKCYQQELAHTKRRFHHVAKGREILPASAPIKMIRFNDLFASVVEVGVSAHSLLRGDGYNSQQKVPGPIHFQGFDYPTFDHFKKRLPYHDGLTVEEDIPDPRSIFLSLQLRSYDDTRIFSTDKVRYFGAHIFAKVVRDKPLIRLMARIKKFFGGSVGIGPEYDAPKILLTSQKPFVIHLDNVPYNLTQRPDGLYEAYFDIVSNAVHVIKGGR